MEDKSILMVKKMATLFCGSIFPKSLGSVESHLRLLAEGLLKTKNFSASTKLTLIRIIKITTSQTIKLSMWFHYDN